MQDFLSKSPEKALQSVAEELYKRLADVRANLIEIMPDWYNPHDYSSGHFKGRQKAFQDEIEFLQNVLDKIERS